MPYKGDDPDQNLLCQFITHLNYRRSESLGRKGALPVYILSFGFLQRVSGRLFYRVDPSFVFEVCICIGSGVSIAFRNEGRASSYPDELLSLLAELHTTYLTARRTLLGPQIAHEVKGMDPAHSELVELVG